ncbi:transporter substrate-binding domain-containing protein [Paucilactobacillus wasatchensis]|uniref:ABC-type amino acid transport/signal transduction system, periplasmic component/domain n=1 Tax=Paucilactobacillus wasatchensis TaxID=1335616 RepID=A0A0D1A7E3_9LACO|nr:transporter substrate-binding domain-containing protein [Paucilactobacillus wasatchensis]KIS02621.1 ABC-type amino acid transport/signal transduction system, periplasmic component/domain [Paucilactobacillus wasatchensis]
MKRLFKVLGGLMAVGLLIIGLAGCGKSSSSSAEKTPGKLTIGLEGTFQPYSYHANHKLTGFEVELGKAIAKKMDLKPVFVETKWDSLIAGLNVDKYDIVLNNVAITKQRAKKYTFTTPYIYSKSQLAVKKDNTSINKITDIKGKKMAETTTSENATDAKRLGATVVPTSDFEQSMALVLQGRADGTINSNGSFGAYLKQKPNANIRLVSGGNSVQTQKIAGILKKGSKLSPKVNKALKELRADGTLTKLSKKYFGTDITKK